MIKTIIIVICACLTVAGGAQADVIVYADTFDNDGLGTNTGIGGGAASTTVSAGTASWSDNGNATYSQSGNNFARAALLHSSNSFQSDDGFELSVSFTTNNTGNAGRNLFSFGLLEDADTYSTLSNPYVENSSEYGIGANVIVHNNSSQTRGLWFADGISNSLLDSYNFGNGSSTFVIRLTPDGAGGANYQYSDDGNPVDSGTIAAFDFSKDFHFAAYGQDNERSKIINSVSLSAIEAAAVPEPSSFAMLGVGALGVLIRRRRRKR